MILYAPASSFLRYWRSNVRRPRLYATLFIAAVVVLAGVAIYWFYVNSLSRVEHETDRWAVIEDVNRDQIAVEPTSDQVWSELVKLHQNGTRMYVGGIVERYDNRWGFRFKSDTIVIAQFTAEGLQGTLQLMSSDIDYWVDLGYAYVDAKVVEVHSPA
jgi:hypothetical protein